VFCLLPLQDVDCGQTIRLSFAYHAAYERWLVGLDGLMPHFPARTPATRAYNTTGHTCCYPPPPLTGCIVRCVAGAIRRCCRLLPLFGNARVSVLGRACASPGDAIAFPFPRRSDYCGLHLLATGVRVRRYLWLDVVLTSGRPTQTATRNVLVGPCAVRFRDQPVRVFGRRSDERRAA